QGVTALSFSEHEQRALNACSDTRAACLTMNEDALRASVFNAATAAEGSGRCAFFADGERALDPRLHALAVGGGLVAQGALALVRLREHLDRAGERVDVRGGEVFEAHDACADEQLRRCAVEIRHGAGKRRLRLPVLDDLRVDVALLYLG